MTACTLGSTHLGVENLNKANDCSLPPGARSDAQRAKNHLFDTVGVRHQHCTLLEPAQCAKTPEGELVEDHVVGTVLTVSFHHHKHLQTSPAPFQFCTQQN